MFDDWAAFDGNERTWEWAAWCSEHPKRLHDLISPAGLDGLDEAKLSEIIWLTHAAREHARQIENQAVGLAAGTELDIRGRCDQFARYLLSQRSTAGRTVGDILRFVLWGDRQQTIVATRILRKRRDSSTRGRARTHSRESATTTRRAP